MQGEQGEELKIIQVLALHLLYDGHTCLDLEVEHKDGEREVMHIRSPEPFVIVERVSE